MSLPAMLLADSKPAVDSRAQGAIGLQGVNSINSRTLLKMMWASAFCSWLRGLLQKIDLEAMNIRSRNMGEVLLGESVLKPTEFIDHFS